MLVGTSTATGISDVVQTLTRGLMLAVLQTTSNCEEIVGLTLTVCCAMRMTLERAQRIRGTTRWTGDRVHTNPRSVRAASEGHGEGTAGGGVGGRPVVEVRGGRRVKSD